MVACSSVSDYKGATLNLPRGPGGRTATYMDVGANASSYMPAVPACGVTDLHGVATEGANGEPFFADDVVRQSACIWRRGTLGDRSVSS